MGILKALQSRRDRRRQEAPTTVPKTVEVAWRPSPAPVVPETPREKFLRERRLRRRTENRIKNRVAKSARKVNRGAYSGR